MALCDYLSKYNKSAVEKYEADFTVVVSKSGDDNALGTEDAPFLTPERAIEELKKIRTSHPKKTVAIKIMGGTYFTDGLYLPKEAGGEKSTPVIIFSYDDAELSCGVRLDASKFSLVGSEEAIRLSEKARKNVYVCDLRSLGLDEDDWGPVYPTGTAQTTALYPGKKKGVNCELVINDRRMTLARYPDEGFIKLEGVISEGFVVADGFGVSRECEKPDPGCFDVGEEVSRRIDGWRDKDDIWMRGFFKYDWAESSTRVFPDTKNHTITPELASRFGAKAGAPYYLFNIFQVENSIMNRLILCLRETTNREFYFISNTFLDSNHDETHSLLWNAKVCRTKNVRVHFIPIVTTAKYSLNIIVYSKRTNFSKQTAVCRI